MKQLRCALYPRVSTEEQFLHGLSLDAQKKDLTDFATRMGYKIVGVYADEGISARKPVSKRPALMRLLTDVEKDKIDIILVTKLDRWFRNIKEYQITQEILERHNCYWKTIFEQYDTSTANGQMVVNIMLAVNQSECDRTSERIKVVLNHKVNNGEHITGAAPYGYVLVDKKAQKDPETQGIVEDIFQHYFSCFSKRKTVNYILNKYSDHPKAPTCYQINRILQSDAYAGVHHGIENFHPAYISMEQFRTIQTTTDTKKYPHTNDAYIFSGLLICPDCGKKLTGFQKKQKLKNGDIRLYKRYRCSNKYSSCSSPCVTESVVENYLLEHVCMKLDSILCTLKASKSKKISRAPEIKAEMQRLNMLYQKGRVTEDYYDSQYTALEAALGAEAAVDHSADVLRYTNLKKEFSGNWRELYEMLDTKHKNAFWKRTIEKVTFDKETHKVNGFFFR